MTAVRTTLNEPGGHSQPVTPTPEVPHSTADDAVRYLGEQVNALDAGKQDVDALLTSISGLTFGANSFIYGTGTDTAAVGTVTAFARSCMAAADEAAFKQLVNLEANTDFGAPGGTDVAVADGGTGASDAAGARTNLGLVIGVDVQAYDADLAAIATLTTTAYGRSMLTYADEAAFKAAVNLEANTDFYAPGGTDVAITDGGTGASDAATARAALGVAFEHISSVTASAASNIDFSLPAGYDYFTIKTNNITNSVDDISIYIRFSQSSTFLSGASDYRTVGIYAVYSGVAFYDMIYDSIHIGSNIGNGSIEKSFFELELQRPLDSGNYINMFYKIGSVRSDGSASYDKGWGRLVKNTNAIDGIRIFPSSGTLTGKFDLFGMKAS